MGIRKPKATRNSISSKKSGQSATPGGGYGGTMFHRLQTGVRVGNKRARSTSSSPVIGRVPGRRKGL